MMTNYPCPIDFTAAWHSCTAQDASHRGDAAVDLAYWQTHAASYDQHSLSPGYYEGTLAAMQNLVRPTDTLLDVGAGAGRFALPLARCVKQVSALDHAGPMLDILHDKIEQQGIANIHLIESAWETATVEPHDVVLAAWSLYRLPDMLIGMKKLIAATRRTLIIVAGAGHSLRHDPLLRAIWPHADQPDTPMHIYYYGILWQAGVHAELQIVTDLHQIRGATPQVIAAQLAPACATARELAAFTTALLPHLVQTADEWMYEQPVPVALLVWHNA